MHRILKDYGIFHSWGISKTRCCTFSKKENHVYLIQTFLYLMVSKIKAIESIPDFCRYDFLPFDRGQKNN